MLVDMVGEDTFIGKPNTDGIFSSSSAWEIIRVKGEPAQWMDWIWYNSIPKKISICTWKARFKCLVVDDRVHHRGITLASSSTFARENSVKL